MKRHLGTWAESLAMVVLEGAALFTFAAIALPLLAACLLFDDRDYD